MLGDREERGDWLLRTGGGRLLLGTGGERRGELLGTGGERRGELQGTGGEEGHCRNIFA